MSTTNLLALEELGLSENAAKAYLALISHGKLSYSQLAHESGLNRASLYPLSKNLIDLGLIVEDTSSPVAQLVAQPVKRLKAIVQKEIDEAERKMGWAERVIEDLSAAAAKAVYPLPQTTLITHEKINSYLHDSTKRWNEDIKATDGIWWGYQDPSFVEYYGEWIKWFWRQPSSKGVQGHIITHRTQAELDLEAATPKDRHIQIMEDMTFTGTQWANGHSIVLINTAGEKHYLTEIIDPVLAANTREVFRKLWEKNKA